MTSRKTTVVVFHSTWCSTKMTMFQSYHRIFLHVYWSIFCCAMYCISLWEKLPEQKHRTLVLKQRKNSLPSWWIFSDRIRGIITTALEQANCAI